MISGVATLPSKCKLKYPFFRMCGENMTKNQRNCCQIAKIFVAIKPLVKYNYDSEKAWKTHGIFFSYFVATLLQLNLESKF